jgi:hypothetical protein
VTGRHIIMKRTIVATVVLLAFSPVAFAADVTGKWIAELPGRGGTHHTTRFNFKVDGAKLTGTVGNQVTGDADITDGNVEGDSISFKEVLRFNGNEITLSYSGVVKGDTIEMERDAGAGARQTFTAKKAQ